MDLHKAKRIEQLRCLTPKHSFGSISDIVCEEYPDEEQGFPGDQYHGFALCQEAMRVCHSCETLDEVSRFVREKWQA